MVHFTQIVAQALTSFIQYHSILLQGFAQVAYPSLGFCPLFLSNWHEPTFIFSFSLVSLGGLWTSVSIRLV